MASIVFGAATFPTRLCVILTSASTGAPISGVPFFCHAVVITRSAAAPGSQPSTTPALDMPLGTLATDQSGYLSFDLSTLERRLEDLQQQQIITGGASTIELDNLWLHPYSPIDQSIDALAVENVVDDALVIRLVVDPDSVYASDGKGFASMQAPGLTDWYLSPGSFGHLSAEIVGQDGCETLLPSNIAVQSFQFIQILPVSQQFALSDASTGNRYLNGNRASDYKLLRPTGQLSMTVATEIASTSLELKSGVPAATSSAGLALYVMYDASWLPVGHGLGQIVYSLPLAPAEQINIAIIDWSRTSTDSRVENTGLTDTLQHDTTRDRTVGEVVDSTVKEWQRGGSIMGGASVTGGYGGVIGAAASIGGAYQTSSGDRSVSANTVQNLSDRFAQTSTSIRDLRSTVIVQSSQQESQNLQTRTVRNYNHSHAMTVLYYEVLRHYRTIVERGDVGPALLIAQSMPDFDEGAVFNYRRFLEPALLMAELAPGFDAGETLYALEQDPPPPPPVDPTTIAFNLFRIIFHCGASTSQASVSAEIRPSDYEGSPISLLGPDGSAGNLGLQMRFVDAANNSVEVQAVPSGGSVTWDGIGFFAITVQLIADKTHDNESLRLDVGLIEVKGIDSNGVEHAMGNWTGNQTYSGPGSEIFPIITAVRPAPPPAPLSALQQLPIDQRHLYVRLIAHLNSNKSYYYKQIWMAEEPNTRAMRFQDMMVTIGGNTLPLLSVVENRVLDVCGAQLVMPMDPSYFASSTISNADRQLLSLPTVAHARTEQLISLPTRGVFAEAKLGHCNASEVIDNTRFWDWQTSPIPDLAPQITGIAPITAQAGPNLTPTAFPASVLSIQQPAPAPDPIGLRAALDVLKTPGIFNNMSGIQQLQGLLTTLTNAAVQAQGLSKQTPPASGQSASGGSTGGGTTPSSPTAPISPSSSGDASTPPSPTTETGGGVIPATVSPEPASPSPVTPTPTPAPTKPTGMVKAVGSKTAIFYFTFTDPILMGVPGYLMITGQEETSDNSTNLVTILLNDNTQGPGTLSASMPMQVSTDKVAINIQAEVVQSDGSTVHTNGSITANAPPQGNVWSFDVNVVLDASRSVTITTHSQTNISAKTAISEQLGILASKIASVTFGITKTEPSVDTTDSVQTTTYGVQEYTNAFNIVQR